MKIPENYCPFVDLMSCGLKDTFKVYAPSYTNTHHDVIDLVNHEIVKNTKV